jgi:diguanylate cyclase (GGDEF)-like protein
MKAQHAKTTILLPIRLDNNVIGLLGMDSIYHHKEPNNSELKQFKTFANIIADAFQKTIAESNIQKLAYYDTLTGLPNRSFLNNKASLLISQMKLSSNQLAVFFIDLDGFKLVNDSIGHTGGDELLIQVSKKIKCCISENDLLCRYSGDEFILVMPDISSQKQFLDVASHILETLREKINVQQNEFIATGKEINLIAEIFDKKLNKNQYKISTYNPAHLYLEKNLFTDIAEEHQMKNIRIVDHCDTDLIDYYDTANYRFSVYMDK